MSKKTRRFEISIELAATPEQVWSALTRAEELVRWFPLEAKVDPGLHGSMFWSWSGAWDWPTRIEAWQPPRRLLLVDEAARGYDADGRPVADERMEPARIAIEITLEGGAGATRLRLVHSGFGEGVRWDEELDGISTGWQFELRSLRHYLKRHPGRDRRVAWARATTSLPAPQAWSRLLGPGGFELQGELLEAGQRWAIQSSATGSLSGRVLLHLPQREFAGIVSELDDGIFRLAAYPAGGRTGLIVWLAVYDPQAPPAGFESEARARLERLFPER